MLPDVYGLEHDERAHLRPIGISILAALFGLGGVGLTLSGLASLIGWLRVWGQPQNTDSSVLMILQILRGAILLVWLLLGFSMLIVNVGMLRLRPWAWWSGLALYAIVGIIELLAFLITTLRTGLAAALPSGILSLIAVIAVCYLLRPRVRMIFLSVTANV